MTRTVHGDLGDLRLDGCSRLHDRRDNVRPVFDTGVVVDLVNGECFDRSSASRHDRRPDEEAGSEAEPRIAAKFIELHRLSAELRCTSSERALLSQERPARHLSRVLSARARGACVPLGRPQH
jgi:hypothetical protein